jgi:hypothetical protein
MYVTDVTAVLHRTLKDPANVHVASTLAMLAMLEVAGRSSQVLCTIVRGFPMNVAH